MVFIHETHVLKSSGKVIWLFQVVSAAQFVSCSKQEQITTLHTFGWYWLHLGINNHITYIWLVLVAPILWLYID